MMKPRDYQLEAAKWAFEKKRAVVCMPTGTGKTLVAGLWIKWLLEKGLAKKILVLEPTRYMVEQTALFLRAKIGLPAMPVHGSLPRSLRKRGFQSKIIVATPEIMVGEGRALLGEFDAVVVDECHHTTGKDAYRLVMEEIRAPYRLGLSAFVPPSRRGIVEEYIGEIRCWSWEDPRIAKYIPAWVGEIYEAELNPAERRLYEELERLWERLHGGERVLIGNALRWFARDGAASLWETYRKPGSKLRKLLSGLEPLLFHPSVRPAHKMEALKRVLADHEGAYEKAIIFVDRIVIAELIARELKEYSPAMILGRRRINPYEAIMRARSPETRVIIATSAGEEGIDLPEADLLIVWSNIASPLRFIQRLGRILRPSPRTKSKVAAFIATPDTVDIDSLIDGLMLAEKAGVRLGISVGTLSYLWGLSRRRRILDLLEEKPLPEDLIAQALEAPRERIRSGLQWLLRHGLIGYIYTSMGRVYYVLESDYTILYETYTEALTPDTTITATVKPYTPRGEERAVRGTYERVLQRLEKLLAKNGQLTRVRASVQAQVKPGLIRMVNLDYRYTIASRATLKLVVDNIYSAGSYATLQVLPEETLLSARENDSKK